MSVNLTEIIFFKNGPAEIDKLIKFLEVDMDDELKQAILDNCNFKKMAKDKIPVDMAEQVFKTEFNFFRKGELYKFVKYRWLSSILYNNLYFYY